MTVPLKILALDDVLIGLDMSNRLPVLDILEAIVLKPDYADAYYRRSKAWLHFGETEKAKTDMQTASKIGINSKTAIDETLRNYERAWKVLSNVSES